MASRSRRNRKPRQIAAASGTAKAPLVTIVVSFRERWRFTADTVESIIRHSGGDYALWVLDPGMPDEVRGALEPHVESGAIRLVPVANGKQPNEWRAEIVSRLSSPFAVFIDNDVVVRAGWLEKMVGCAEETGAGIVCPLYLWGEGADSDVIHMAGGALTLQATPSGTKMTERHRHVDKTTGQVPEDLHRRTCGFGEFHCLMMRREIYSAAGMFDPGIVTIHEHIHASMLARELGYETWFEPDSRVTYLAFAPWQAGDLKAARERWDYGQAMASMAAFAKRWSVIDDEEYRIGIRQFLGVHAGHTDLLDPRPKAAARREQIMTRADHQQTLAGLQWLAHDSGYDRSDLCMLTLAYKVAAGIVDGIYRPCGRPFINHLTGTASVLLFYGCALPHAMAGLMHAALTHGPKPMADRLLNQFSTLNTIAEGAVKLVHQYGERGALLDAIDPARIADLPVGTAALIAIDAANEVDMLVSWEVAMTGRTDIIPEPRLDAYDAVLPYVGLPGLAASLRQLRADAVPWPGIEFQPGAKASVRFKSSRPGAAPAGTRPPAPAGQVFAGQPVV